MPLTFASVFLAESTTVVEIVVLCANYGVLNRTLKCYQIYILFTLIGVLYFKRAFSVEHLGSRFYIIIE